MRFSNNDYIQYKLKDVCTINIGLTHTPKYVNDGVKFISSKNISNDMLNLEDINYISKEEFESITNSAKPRKGDILFTRVGSNLGHPVIYEYDENICIFVSLGFIRVKDELVINDYIKHWMNSQAFWNQVKRKTAGAAKINLNNGWMYDFDLKVPSLKDQRIISTFLDNLDNKIQTQIKIINNLESQKKYISKTLFNSLECKTQLCMLCDIKKGQQLNGDKLLDNGKYYMMNGGITPSGFTNTFNTSEHTISISEGGNSCGYVQYNLDKFWSGGHCYTLEEINPIINNKFLYHFLKHKENEIMSLRIGTGLPNIQKKDLERFMVPTPTIEQQIKISKVLDVLDNKLKLLNLQLIQFNLKKRYLLNNMFI